ncbi:MAG: sulfotransferase, partial [Caulobacteraceae bacterium]|nr:sulfotransferase [Caulobacteraceae bacterium]
NALARAIQLPVVGALGLESGVELVERLLAYFRDGDTPWSVHTPDPVKGPRRHAFLVGFYRSGTTLLEQILASHPDVRILEEKPILETLALEYMADDAGLARLARLGADEAEGLRARYWDEVARAGVAADRAAFVDKLPVGALWAPFIRKVFPGAGLIVIRRDPRDVVLSCFRHRFHPAPILSEFTDLERTARLYAGVMALTELYGERLGIEAMDLRQEDLVADFEGEARRVIDFLGVPWRDEVRGFAADAREREIRTPSADQVRRGLNASGVGHWRGYAAELAPVAPILAPWVAQFGYPA